MRRGAVDCFLKGDLLGDSGALERLARCYVVGNVAGWFAVAKHLLGLATQMSGGLWGNGQVSVLVLGEC